MSIHFKTCEENWSLVSGRETGEDPVALILHLGKLGGLQTRFYGCPRDLF